MANRFHTPHTGPPHCRRVVFAPFFALEDLCRRSSPLRLFAPSPIPCEITSSDGGSAQIADRRTGSTIPDADRRIHLRPDDAHVPRGAGKKGKDELRTG